MADPTAPRIDYAATLDCVHCGLCLPACPTYRETGRESSSPRGRIYMMRAVAEGRIELDAAVAEEMYFCLACRACESACPAGVRYGHLVETARAEIDARGARPAVRRILERAVLRHVVASRRGLSLVAGALRGYQRSGVQDFVRRTRLLDVLAKLPGLGGIARAERGLPLVPDAYRPPILVPARGRRRGRVAFFEGCVMPELFAPVQRATIQVLSANGFEVHVPPRQACCGALHLHSGDPAAAARLRRRNRSAFEPESVDAVVVNSAGCGAALKDAGDDLGTAVRDVCEFLCEVGLTQEMSELRMRVAYDDPCHLQHGQRITEAPRALLRAIPGLELVDLPGASECCGAAGIYSLTHPDMSEQLLARKVEALRGCRADVLATGNPGCLMQLAKGAREAGLATTVVHPVELLARAGG